MVWGLFPVDPIPGEESYYFFSKGTYKVGRKGCDVIVNKDKGVSRVHAEIVIDEMISKDNTTKKSSEIRIRDCSKYGTYIKRPVGSKEKVHEFPNKETTLDDADLVSFGTGNATYRFSYVPLVFFLCGLEPGRSKEHNEKISSVGASMTNKWNAKCTHVLVDDNALLNADIVDAVMSKRHFVSYKWIELLADKRIDTTIPDCNTYAPTLKLQGVSIKVVEPESRENCLSGYTFLLESSDKYKVKKKLQSLLEAFGAKVIPVGEFVPHSQGVEDDEKNRFVHVISEDNSVCSNDINHLPKVSEINLVSAILSGHLDAVILVSPPVVVTSTCSTDETIVADSEPEVEITSVYTSGIRKVESVEDEKEITFVHSVDSVTVMEIDPTKFNVDKDTSVDDVSAKSKDGQNDDGMLPRERKIDVDEGSEMGTSDVVFSQDLIVRNSNSQPSYQTNHQVLNFKRFKKMATESGIGFHNLVPFSKHPYKGSEYENEEVAESLKEEKKRKQREAVAEDLFNNAKAKQRGAAGFLSGLFKGR
ncbi:putative transcription factor interactor and regulator FHA-SMAD family [Helianthus annuus]|nr:putative transcription factor interactor and regulator FHA-SMAD family [Helianthus annuus]KAJ0462633.1 putative transcription factor interactor and regulator FHA-SMAD family [Helianthus annuus]